MIEVFVWTFQTQLLIPEFTLINWPDYVVEQSFFLDKIIIFLVVIFFLLYDLFDFFSNSVDVFQCFQIDSVDFKFILFFQLNI